MVKMIRRFFSIVCPLLAAALPAAADITPVWSAGVAVPGEKVVLYLIDTEIGQDLFMVKARPNVKQARVELQQPKAGANPLDANRAAAEVYPIIVTPDVAGELQLPTIEVEYKSGRKQGVEVPPLPVVATSEIKWMNKPVPYGVLWHTDVKDGYVSQPVRTAVKIFLPGSCAVGGMPVIQSAGVKAGQFQAALQGIAAMVHGEIVNSPTAYAKGQQWRTADLTGTLIPIKEGNSDVGGKFTIVQQQGFFTQAQAEAELPFLTVGALPLPPGKPSDFADMVGYYIMEARTDAKTVGMNEVVDVEITVRGTGNLEQLACPKLMNAAGWKLVPATRRPLVNANGETEGMVFNQLMRPTQEVSGIPGFAFSFFNPGTMQYEQAQTKPIALEWRESDTGAQGGTGLTVAAEPPPAGTVPVEEMTDIYGWLPDNAVSRAVVLPRWLWCLLYLPAAGVLLWVLVQALRRKLAAGAADRARERELTRLEEEQDNLAFLRRVGAYIESRIPAQHITPQLQAILDKRDAEAFRPQAEMTLTPAQRQDMMKLLRKAVAKAGTAVLLLLAVLLPAAHGADAWDATMQNARSDYEKGQYSHALQWIDQAPADSLPDHPHHAAESYYRGNCLYRLGQPGKAALAYARALQIAPQLREARANLAFIQRKEGAILPTGEVTDQVMTFFTVSQLWVLTVCVTAALALCAALLLLRRGQEKPWLNAATVFCAVLTLLCALDWAYYATRQTPDLSSLPPSDIAYILEKTPARSAADDAASPVIELPASTPVHLLAARGSYSYVETFAGTRGWVKSSALEALVPNGTPRTPLLISW